MIKNLLDSYVELTKEDKESLLKLLKEDLGISEFKKYTRYDELIISGDTYFVLNYDKETEELLICMKDIIPKEDIKKYFTDKWYADSDCDVRYNSDIRNNRFK